MRNLRTASFVAALLLTGWIASPVQAQATKSARGTITAMSSDSVSVKAGDRELKFMVNSTTRLIAAGGGTAERRAAAAGTSGPRLSDLVKVGDPVEVNYGESGGALHATSIRKITSAGAGSGSMSADSAESANGTVESLSGSTLSIAGSSGSGSSFKQSFTVDNNTRVIAVGASTAAAGQGGKISLADFVGVGDQVSVSFRKMGSGLHADQVRVLRKK